MYSAPAAARRTLLTCAIAVVVVVCQGAPLIRAPYLQNVGSDSATILWTSPDRVAATVRYSLNGDLSSTVTASVRALATSPGQPPVYQYRADLKNLKQSREYFYEVSVNGEAITDNLRFRTEGPGPFRFLVFGDSGTGNEAQLKLAQRMAEVENPSLVLHTGDLSQEEGTPEQLDTNYLKVYGQLMGRAPFFASPGNHDYYTDNGNPCFAIHAPPTRGVPAEDAGRYYSFDWGNVHFVSLNSNLLEFPDAAARMLSWLDTDLARQKNFWKIVYFHHLPYPTGHHLGDPVSEMARQRIVPILERHDVQLVFNGHEHSYQRTHPLRAGAPTESGGTVYVTSAGGGGGLHPINGGSLHAIGISAHHYVRADVRGARITLTVVGVEGDVLDSVVLTAPTQPTVETVVNAASYTPALAPGSIVSIFGRDLAVDERTPATAALELAGASVTLDGERLPLLYVSPHQINAQLPYGVLGQAVLRVHSRTDVEERSIEIAASAPAVLTVPLGFRQFPAIVNAAGNKLVTPSSPVRAGDYVSLYLLGLGEVDRPIEAGAAAPANPLLYAQSTVRVHIGGTSVVPLFAGLMPGFAGVYQLNFQIPAGLLQGPNSLRVLAGETDSDPVTLFVGRQ